MGDASPGMNLANSNLPNELCCLTIDLVLSTPWLTRALLKREYSILFSRIYLAKSKIPESCKFLPATKPSAHPYYAEVMVIDLYGS